MNMNNKIDVKIKRLSDTAIVPTYGSEFAACCDLYADLKGENNVTINPHTTVKIGIGWSIQPPEGFYCAIYARSGLSTKQGLRPSNCVGIGDEDYRGEYIVALHNDTDEVRTVEHGDRIAQMTFVPYYQAVFEEVDELTETDRGSGGFGSTGK